MFPKQSYRLLRQLTGSLHGAQAKTLLAVTGSLLSCGQMRSFALAQQLADNCQIKLKSGLQRFYRFVHNRGFDDLTVWSQLAHHLLAAAGKPAVVAVDWTEWHSGLRVLAATACVGRRAVPIYGQTFPKADMPRSQNSRENAFLRVVSTLTPMIRRAILIFDRGFRRVSFIRELQLLDHRLVVRLTAKVMVRGPATRACYPAIRCNRAVWSIWAPATYGETEPQRRTWWGSGPKGKASPGGWPQTLRKRRAASQKFMTAAWALRKDSVTAKAAVSASK